MADNDDTAAAIAPPATAAAAAGDDEEEEDLEKLSAEIARMEEEAARIAAETEELEKANATSAATSATATKAKSGGVAGGSSGETSEEKIKKDGYSIYVGQVDYSTTPEELLSHFESCGVVERVTIVCDKITGRPKGFAYLEFQTEIAVENALKLDGSIFKERQLKVTAKRVNDPNFYNQQQQQYSGYQGRGGGRFGAGARGGGYRGGGRFASAGGFGRGGRGRGGGGRAYRGRGRGFQPY
ncbi:hypothetical protein ACHAWU_000320 [Discostella pseudostelligera]|uniref:RRM domain-containing protein n=1 Tax=Discostella pseudostelligera TaxID=259834 RepID=A0ABD3MRB9_9STRA